MRRQFVKSRSCQMGYVVISQVHHIVSVIAPHNPDSIFKAGGVVTNKRIQHDGGIRPIIVTERFWLERY